jgi:hypothetical protein
MGLVKKRERKPETLDDAEIGGKMKKPEGEGNK